MAAGEIRFSALCRGGKSFARVLVLSLPVLNWGERDQNEVQILFRFLLIIFVFEEWNEI